MARLNVQAMARREVGLMECIVADPGTTIISADLSAGEPTVVTHYSKDKNYFAANFGMIGKAPYYDANGVLYISDMYFMGASVSPTGRATMREAFHTTWKGASFAEMWLTDEEFLKDELKSVRKPHKTQILAIMYGQMPKGMVSNAYENGFSLALKDAREFHHNFWNVLFPDVRRLGEVLQFRFAREGFLVNEFGYRLVPDKPRKCLNYFIQSSVSGLMHCLFAKFFSICPYAEFQTCIHDELVVAVPSDRLDEAKTLWQTAVDSLNADLNWTVQIRTGWKPGHDWYSAH